VHEPVLVELKVVRFESRPNYPHIYVFFLRTSHCIATDVVGWLVNDGLRKMWKEFGVCNSRALQH
jgi:hypothetical protein